MTPARLNLERELGADGKKVDSFTLQINFLLPSGYKAIDFKQTQVVVPKDTRWDVLSEGKLTINKNSNSGSWQISFRQRDNEAKSNTAAIIKIVGTYPDGSVFGGSLRIRVITTKKNLPPSQRDKP